MGLKTLYIVAQIHSNIAKYLYVGLQQLELLPIIPIIQHLLSLHGHVSKMFKNPICFDRPGGGWESLYDPFPPPADSQESPLLWIAQVS